MSEPSNTVEPEERGDPPVSIATQLRRVLDTSYTLEEPLDPRRDDVGAIAENE